LLNEDYYIVYSAREYPTLAEYLPNLRYNQSAQLNDIVVLKKADIPFLLPKEANSILHLNIKDSLAKPGMDYEHVDIKGDFTMEILVKPVGTQVPGASIVNNLSQFTNTDLRGFVVQKNGDIPDQYVFGVSNGTPVVPNATFALESNKWHYLVVTANKDVFRIYDNGTQVATANVGGAMYPNSELPMTIGNRSSRDAHFSGFISEIKISNGNLDPNEISGRGQKLNATLNNQVTN
jgi:hypothetical protein